MAGIFAQVGTQVGLQLLLQPYSHTIGNIAWQVIFHVFHHHLVIFSSYLSIASVIIF